MMWLVSITVYAIPGKLKMVEHDCRHGKLLAK